MPKKITRAVTTSTSLPAAQVAVAGGVRIYLSGTYINVEAYLDANSNAIVPQPINGVSLANAGAFASSAIYLPPGVYRFVQFPAGYTGGPVGLPFEDPVLVT
jgi:hypothetical protein